MLHGQVSHTHLQQVFKVLYSLSPELGLVWQDTPVGRVYAMYRNQRRINSAWMDMASMYKCLCNSWLVCYKDELAKDNPKPDKRQQYLSEIGI